MYSLLLFILISYGMTNIVTEANGPFRCFVKLRDYANNHFPSNLGEMFSCQICFPFWVGVFLSLFVFSPTAELSRLALLDYFTMQPLGVLAKTLIVVLCDGCLASGATWILHNIEEYFEYGVEK